MSLSTITYQSRLNYISIHADLLPISGVGGFANEPGLSICNEAMSEIINNKNDWKFNQIEMCSVQKLTSSTGQPLVIYQSKQDYLFAGASAFTMTVTPSGASTGTNSSGASVDLASNSAVQVAAGVVTVTTLEPHRFKVNDTVRLVGLVAQTGNSANAANYNNVFTDDGNTSKWNTGYVITAVTTSSFSFAAITGQNNGDVLGAPGITNFGWLERAQMIEINNNSSPPNVRQLKAQRKLPMWSKIADPELIAVMNDDGNGTLTVRVIYLPAAVSWFVNLVYQKAATINNALTSTFDPIPDRYLNVIDQAVIYRAYRYLQSNKAEAEYTKLQKIILEAKGTDQSEEAGFYLEPMESLSDLGPYIWSGGY